MYRYFIDYDLTQYQQLENKLNDLSQKGINPTHLGKLSTFKKNDKQYYYHVDFLTKKPSTSQKKAIRDMIDDYEKNYFDYVGKIDKFMIFRTENQQSIPTNRKKAIEQHLQIREISALTYFVLTLIPVLYVSYHVLNQNQITNFLTNGSLLLHYSVLLLAMTLLSRTLHKLILAYQYKNKKNSSSIFKKVFYVSAILSLCVITIGCILDITERKQVNVDQQILTLGFIGLEDNFKDHPFYIKTNSIIVESQSYVETNQNNDAIYSKCYLFHHKKDIDIYFERYKKDILCQPYITINDDTYIINIDGYNDSILFKTAQGFVYVTTSQEIYDNQLYLKIIDFYK